MNKLNKYLVFTLERELRDTNEKCLVFYASYKTIQEARDMSSYLQGQDFTPVIQENLYYK